MQFGILLRSALANAFGLFDEPILSVRYRLEHYGILFLDDFDPVSDMEREFFEEFARQTKCRGVAPFGNFCSHFASPLIWIYL
jgi:hypothetical protein